MKKLLFLFNPVAGKAQIGNRLHKVIDFYSKKGYLVSVMMVEYLDKFSEELSSQLDYYDLIVCAGGDGTLNRVISKCIDARCPQPIGYLPVGTTNDFARTLGYGSNFDEALERSCGGMNRLIDIGKFNNQYFIYIAAFGSLAEVSYTTPQWSKNILGHFAYLMNGIQRVTDLKSYSLIIKFDEKIIEDDFCAGLIMNSLSIGGFKNPVSEFVVLDDGLFEVLFIKMPRNISELQKIIIDLLGQRFDSNMFLYTQAGHLDIRSELMEWSLDGEFGGAVQEVEIWNYRQAIKIAGDI